MASNGSKVEKEEMISVALQLQKDFLANPQKPATSGPLEAVGGWVSERSRH